MGGVGGGKRLDQGGISSVGSGSLLSSGSFSNKGVGGFEGWRPSRVKADDSRRKSWRADIPFFVPRIVGSQRSFDAFRSFDLSASWIGQEVKICSLDWNSSPHGQE